jgi:hypothetical protein
MQPVYVVIENGMLYGTAYATYAAAVKAVKEKHAEYLEELHYLSDIESMLEDVNVPENKATGISHLYIEKGINILIHKLHISQ